MPRLAGRARKVPQADHEARAEEMRQHPRMWIQVGEYGSRSSVLGMIKFARDGERIKSYQPASAYELRIELTEFRFAVYGRYVGGAK